MAQLYLPQARIAIRVFILLLLLKGLFSLTGTLYQVRANSTLPVTLINFIGTPENGSVVLSWRTAQEVNSKQYEVEYSMDAINYQQAGIVPAGNYLVVHEYRFNHTVFNANKVYYRLKMVDIDGRYEYSTVISVTITGTAKNYIYPTIITTGRVSVYLSESFQSIDIINMEGKILRREYINGRTGRIDLSLPTNASGTCVVKLTSHDPQKTVLQKIIIR